MDVAQMAEAPIFSELSETALTDVIGRLKEVRLSVGESLIDQDDLSYKFFVILEGSAEVRRDGVPIARLGPGEFVGEHGILEHERRSAEVIVTEPLIAAVAIGWDVRDLMAEHASIRHHIRRVDAERSEA